MCKLFIMGVVMTDVLNEVIEFVGMEYLTSNIAYYPETEVEECIISNKLYPDFDHVTAI